MAKLETKMEPKQKQALFVILIVGIALLYYFLYYGDLSEKHEKMRYENATIDGEIRELEHRKTIMIKVREEASRLEKRFETLKSKLPETTDELNLFLSSISQRAQTSRVSKWTLFRQEALVPQGEVSAVRIQMQFLSTFEAANAFFRELSEMGDELQSSNKEQIVNVRELEMRKVTGTKEVGVTLVDVRCVAETYLYTGLPAAPQGGTDVR